MVILRGTLMCPVRRLTLDRPASAAEASLLASGSTPQRALVLLRIGSTPTTFVRTAAPSVPSPGEVLRKPPANSRLLQRGCLMSSEQNRASAGPASLRA